MKYPELVDAIGQEAALRLAQEVGGENTYIPKPPRRVVRKEKILALLRAGHPTKDIATATGLTVRRVQQVIKSEIN